MSHQKTGGGPGVPDLTDLESKLISVCGKVSVLGDTEVPEGGIIETTLTSPPIMETTFLFEPEIDGNEPEMEAFFLVNETDKENLQEDEMEELVQVQQKGEERNLPTGNTRKRKYVSRKGAIQETLKEYSTSTQIFAECINKLAGSINALADSNIILAEAIKEIGNREG